MTSVIRWICVLLITANTALTTVAAEPIRPCITVRPATRVERVPAHCERVGDAEMLKMTRHLLQQHQHQATELPRDNFPNSTWGSHWSHSLTLDIF